MRTKPVIQKLISFLLLLLMVATVVPRTFLHDALADHKDLPVCEQPSKVKDCLHQQHFACGFSQHVVQASFDAVVAVYVLKAPQPFLTYSGQPLREPAQQPLIYKETRGPPFC